MSSWIPLTSQEPPDAAEVLFWGPGCGYFVAENESLHDLAFVDEQTGSTGRPTHWMPLPAAPDFEGANDPIINPDLSEWGGADLDSPLDPGRA